jgi:hypothetical protein
MGKRGVVPMYGLWIVPFLIAVGFTSSGIVANLYRVAGFSGEGRLGGVLRAAVMVIAGPTVIIESAMRGRAAKKWSPMGFWLVTGATIYWSLALGLLVLDVALHI